MLRLPRSVLTPLVVAPLTALLALAAFAACAEQSEDGSPIVKTDTGVSDVAADSGAPDTAIAHDSAASETAISSGAVVLNEMRASGGDYLEVLNVSSKPVDLSGWQLSALKNDDASSPNVFTEAAKESLFGHEIASSGAAAATTPVRCHVVTNGRSAPGRRHSTGPNTGRAWPRESVILHSGSTPCP